MPIHTTRIGTGLRIANRAIELNAKPRAAGASPCRPSSDCLYTGQNSSTTRDPSPPLSRSVRLMLDRCAARSATHLVAQVPEDVSRNIDAGSDSLLRQFPHASLLPGT